MGQSKEPIRLRQRRTPSGLISLYLDIYLNGRRSYEYLKMYLVPEKTRADREKNRETRSNSPMLSVQNGLSNSATGSTASNRSLQPLLVFSIITARFAKNGWEEKAEATGVIGIPASII